jgi:ribosomal-protein-alanine N-acetyltransferase
MTMAEEPPWFPVRTQRLLLREFREADVDDVHAYATDPEVSRFMAWGPNTPDQTRDFMERKAAEQAEWPRDAVNLAMEHLADGRVIGSIRLQVADHEHRTADLGYSLHRRYWRQGYGSEAAAALVDLAFVTLGMHRVCATCDVRNAGSYGIMEKLGMRREGCLRQNVLVKGAWRDTYLYAILAEEWISPG